MIGRRDGLQVRRQTAELLGHVTVEEPEARIADPSTLGDT